LKDTEFRHNPESPTYDVPVEAIESANLIANSDHFGLFPALMEGIEGNVWVLSTVEEGEPDIATPVAVMIIGALDKIIKPDPAFSSEVDTTLAEEGTGP